MTTYQAALRLMQNGADPVVIAKFIAIEIAKSRAAHPSAYRYSTRGI